MNARKFHLILSILRYFAMSVHWEFNMFKEIFFSKKKH